MTANYHVKAFARNCSYALKAFPRISCHTGRHFSTINES